MQKYQINRSSFWNGTLLGLAAGTVLFILYQYLGRILREPRLISKAFFSEDDAFDSRNALAMFITAENLRSGIHTRLLAPGLNKEILHAGYRNFRECWARDFGFASFGLIAVEQYKVTRETLEAFFWHQTEEGQLPVKLFSLGIFTRFLHSLFGREQSMQGILKPKYRSGHGAPSLDGQALLIIAALNYAERSGDEMFLNKYWHQFRLALAWLGKHHRDPDGLLLKQGAYADWADSIARHGYVHYTNVVFWKALTEMARAASRLDLKHEAVQYFSEAESVSRAINEKLWRPELGYFATSNSLDNLSSDGNLLAIAWGLAQPEQVESIVQTMEEARMAEPVPTRVVHPSYPPYLVAIENRLGGLGNYHTDASWLWLGAWHLIALTRSGRLEDARKILERIVDVIVQDRQVNEVHGPDGVPLASFWYKSEAPLTWNAGMIIYAHHVYEQQLQAEMSILPSLERVNE